MGTREGVLRDRLEKERCRKEEKKVEAVDEEEMYESDFASLWNWELNWIVDQSFTFFVEYKKH